MEPTYRQRSFLSPTANPSLLYKPFRKKSQRPAGHKNLEAPQTQPRPAYMAHRPASCTPAGIYSHGHLIWPMSPRASLHPQNEGRVVDALQAQSLAGPGSAAGGRLSVFPATLGWRGLARGFFSFFLLSFPIFFSRLTFLSSPLRGGGDGLDSTASGPQAAAGASERFPGGPHGCSSPSSTPCLSDCWRYHWHLPLVLWCCSKPERPPQTRCPHHGHSRGNPSTACQSDGREASAGGAAMPARFAMGTKVDEGQTAAAFEKTLAASATAPPTPLSSSSELL